MDKKKISKEEIVAEYLTSNISYRALEKKYGVPSRSICDWVLKYQGRLPNRKEQERLRKIKEENAIELPTEVKILQKELRKSQLKNELLEEMLKLSEEHTGIELRKKFGIKQ